MKRFVSFIIVIAIAMCISTVAFADNEKPKTLEKEFTAKEMKYFEILCEDWEEYYANIKKYDPSQDVIINDVYTEISSKEVILYVNGTEDNETSEHILRIYADGSTLSVKIIDGVVDDYDADIWDIFSILDFIEDFEEMMED